MIGVQPGSQIERILAALPRVGGISFPRLLAKVNADKTLPEVEANVLSASLCQAINRHHYVKRLGNSRVNYTYQRDQPAAMAKPPKVKGPKRIRVKGAKAAKPVPARTTNRLALIAESVGDEVAALAFVPRDKVVPRPRVDLPERVLCAACDTFGRDPDCEDCIRPWRSRQAQAA